MGGPPDGVPQTWGEAQSHLFGLPGPLRSRCRPGLPVHDASFSPALLWLCCSDDEREGPYVEMDLACGLFDLKDPAAVAAAEAAMAHRGVAVEAYGAGSSDDSSDDSSDGDSNVSNEGQEGEDEEERLRQALGIVAAAQHPQQHERQPLGQQREGSAPAASAGDDAMEEDAPARQLSPVAAAAGPAAGMEDGAAAGAPPGRRRKHKGRRHAGIEELS